MLAQIALDDAIRCPGLKALLLRKVGKAGRESFEDLRLRLLMGVPHDYRRQDGTLSLGNGSRVILGHFKDERDVDAYLGLEYDVIGIEEATTLSASKVKVVNSCRRTSKPGWRPRTYYTTNPGGLGHAWFKAKFITPDRKGAESDTRFIPATARDNAFLNPEYVRNLEGLTGWLRRAWLDGDWDIAAGQFFTTFRREVHVVEPRCEVPENWRVWCGFDYGWTHYTSCHVVALDGDGNLHILGEHAARRWLPERHAAAIHQLLARKGIGRHRLDGILAGPDVFSKQRDGATVADGYAPHGIHFRPANTDRIGGAAEILRRLGDPDAGIEPKLFIGADCPRLIEALAALEHDPHRPEDVLKIDCDDDGLGGDDAYDSARYAISHAMTRNILRHSFA